MLMHMKSKGERVSQIHLILDGLDHKSSPGGLTGVTR